MYCVSGTRILKQALAQILFSQWACQVVPFSGAGAKSR